MKKLFTGLLILLQFTVPAQQRITDSLIELSKNQKGEALADRYTEIAYYFRSENSSSAISYINKALDIIHKFNYTKGEANALLVQGYIYSVQSKYELSLDYANKALELAKQLNNDSLIGYAKVSIGGYHYNKSNYDEAIRYYLEAIRIFEKNHIIDGAIKARSNMALVYQIQGKLELAEKVIRECLDLNAKNPDKVAKLNLLHVLANVYGMQGKYAEALAIDQEGIELCKQTGSRFLESQFYDNIANCNMYSGDYGKAYTNFMECIKIDSSFDNKKQMADTYLNLGNLMMMQHKYAESAAYLFHSIQLSNISGYKQAKYQSLQLLSDIYKAMGQPDKALKYLKDAYTVKDSILNTSTEEKIAELETVYQTQQKEQQLKLKNAELGKKNYLISGLAGALILFTLLGLTFYRKRQVQHKMRLQETVMQQQDLATRAVLNAEENERKRIAADLHDGVGQMMSAAKMNLSAFESENIFQSESQRLAYEKAISLVDESCKEIRSISHQMMPNALLKSGLSSAVKEFIDKIDSRILKINLHTEGLNERLDANTETVLYRVIQECVNNVIKHAGASSLDISLIRDQDGISATIEDNGRGFDTSDKKKSDGIGMQNITSRVAFLKGTVDFDSQPGKGTLVAIHVPLKENS